MIVSSMTSEEIRTTLWKEWSNKQPWVEECKKVFRRCVVKSSHFPIAAIYERRNTGMLFVLHFFANSKKNANVPLITSYCVYDLPEGKYAASISINGIIQLYPPHFFHRYKERILKEDVDSPVDLIKLFFKNNSGCVISVKDINFQSVGMTYDEFLQGEHFDAVATCNEGYIFCKLQGQLHIMKTIISEDMVFENQKSLFDKLRAEFNRSTMVI